MTEEQQKVTDALAILIEAVEIVQTAGTYTITDSAQIFAAIRFFKPDYGIQKSDGINIDEKSIQK